MELRFLQYFIVLAEELHFGRAAAWLLVAQPSLSYALNELEQELGVVLLKRDRRSVSLTEAGKAVLIEAQWTLDQAERVRSVAEQFRARQTGMLRAGFEACAGYLWSSVPKMRAIDVSTRSLINVISTSSRWQESFSCAVSFLILARLSEVATTTHRSQCLSEAPYW